MSANANYNDRVNVNADSNFSDAEWVEIRIQGKLPERRSNHAAFVAVVSGAEYL